MPVIKYLPQGIVTAIWGQAVLILPDGSTRPLHVGEEIHAGDRILTSQNGIVRIDEHLIVPPTAQAHHAGAPDALDAAIAELENGTAAPAAGYNPLPEAGSGSLTPGLRVARVAEEVSPLNYSFDAAHRVVDVTAAVAPLLASAPSSGAAPATNLPAAFTGGDTSIHVSEKGLPGGLPEPAGAAAAGFTANASVEDRYACFEAGMDGFLVKPLDREKLAEVISGFVSSRHLAA